jgi:hypothetical protein
LIHIVRKSATKVEIEEMLQALGAYIKLAVDVNRRILAGGGTMHADCEAEMLIDGSSQENVWGADWYPASQEVSYESLINIRPAHGNRSLEVQDDNLKAQIEQVVRELLEETPHE